MKRKFGPRTFIKLGLFAAFLVVIGTQIYKDKDNYASIILPPIPESHYAYINEAVDHCKVPRHKRGLIASIARSESTFNPKAQSSAGAVGVMQVLRGTGFGVANQYQISGLNAQTFTDPRLGYLMGTCYMESLVSRLGNDDPAAWDNDRIVAAALIGYNAGPARGASYLAGNYNGPLSSVGYAAKIQKAEQVYKFDFARYDQLQSQQGGINFVAEVREVVWDILLGTGDNN